MSQHSTTQLPVDNDLYTGIDVGGTKVVIIDSSSATMHRYDTNDYTNMEPILDDYFLKLGRRPRSVGLVMAGPRDDDTGIVKLTNANWKAFSPSAAEQLYRGTHFETMHDMVGTAAGAFAEPGVELETLKPGLPTRTGTKLVVTVSTGIGAAAAVWDNHTKRYVFMATEAGHIGIQPENDDESAYLRYLQKTYAHVSAEIALSGLAGIDSLVDHMLSLHPTPALARAVDRARQTNRPVGAVLLEFATEGTGTDKDAAGHILARLGMMLGSVIRDLAVAFKASGGIYLTGSIALALGEYFCQNTGFLKRFVHEGASHETMIEKIPIYLITDPHVAVKGALALAQQTR